MAAAEGAEKGAAMEGEVAGDFLPPEFLDVTPLTDEEMEKIDERLRECAERRDPEGLDRLIGAAMWDEASRERRQALIFRSLMAFLLEEVSKEKVEMKNLLGSFSRHVLFALWRMSLHPDMDRVRAYRGKAGAPCVFIMGFAGSRLEEVKAQEDFYRSLGFSTVLANMCIFPMRMRQRQLARIAWALSEGLDPESPRLLVHCCSGQGGSLLNAVCRLWGKGFPPFDKLPALTACLSAFVFECMAPVPVFEHVTWPIPEDMQEWADALSEEASEGRHFVFFGAANNTMDEMTKRHMPETSWWSIAGRHKELSLLLRSTNPYYEKWEDGEYGAHLPWWRDGPHWTDVEGEMAGSKTSVPRLFLFSKLDKLFSEEAVGNAIDAQWSLLPRQTKIVVEKCAKSQHCKLWVTEKSVCEKAVQKLLKIAKLKKP